ncbi:MAG: hypothetical protein Fur0018_24710 [Anaerolineales bacterium]
MNINKNLYPKLAWGLVLLVTVVGLGAIGLRVAYGLRVTNLNYLVPWGLWVAFYIYFIGLSAGSFLMSTMVYVFGFKKLEPIGRVALFSALIALIAGMNFVLLDLGHMERALTVFFNRNLWSVLEIEIHFYVVYIAIILGELWLLMRRDLVRCGQGTDWKARICRLLAFGSQDVSDESVARDHRLVRILGLVGVPVAIGVHGGTGALFAVVKARPMWYGPLFPIIFIVSALVSGSALLTFLIAFFAGRKLNAALRRDLVLTLGKITAGVLLFDLLLMWSEFSVGIYGAIPEDLEVMRLTFFGPFWWVFWLVQILFGAIVPLALILWPVTGRNPKWAGFAGLMIVVGIIGVRLNIVIPALNLPVLPGFDNAYTMLPAPTITTPAYPPVLLAWLSRLAVLAAALTFVVLGVIGLRRFRREPAYRLERYLASVVTALGAVVIVAAGLRWVGGTSLGLTFPSVDLTHTPLSGILGHTNLRFYYIPSPNEWLSSAGLIGLAVLLFGLGYTILPLESDEH